MPPTSTFYLALTLCSIWILVLLESTTSGALTVPSSSHTNHAIDLNSLDSNAVNSISIPLSSTLLDSNSPHDRDGNAVQLNLCPYSWDTLRLPYHVLCH